MKRSAALFLCIALLLAVHPLPAMADNPAQTAFIDHYLHYYDSSAEVQNFFIQALAQNTINFKLDANLASSNVVLDNGAVLSNMPGRASLDLAFNLKSRKAALDFQAAVAQYDVRGKIYYTDQGIIIPRETVKALTAAGADFSELGDLNRLPDYLVYPSDISSDDWDEFDRQLQLTQVNQARQVEATRSLLKEILLTIPDKCYYYSGSDPVLDLSQISLDSPELLASLKAQSASLAEKAAEMANQPVNVSTQEWYSMKSTIKAEMIANINSLTSEQMTQMAGEMPFDLQRCKITINANHCDTSLAMQMNLPDKTSMSLGIQSITTISSGAINSQTNSDITLNTSDSTLDISLNSNTSVNKTRGQFDLNISGSGTDKKTTISGKLDLDARLDWIGTASLSVPTLNSINSRIAKRNALVEQQPIRVFLEGRELYFAGNSPWISEGNTMIPLSSLTQPLGYNVDWQPPDTIIISNGSNENLTLYLNSTTYYIGGQEFQSNAVPAIVDGRTCIPLRVLADYYNLTVEWNAATRTINLHRS
ncbi:MAG: copper amine oxidase N-terminal domain-containing protein [Syntrophomonadaceae bacterium]